MDHSSAASELVAVVILIAIFAVAVGIVGVFMLSNPQTDEAPAMLASVVYDNSTADDHRLILFHDGGDPLHKGEFQIFVNGIDQTNIFAGENGSTDWTVWENGQSLTLDLGSDPEPDGVLITSEGIGGSGAEWVLHLVGEGSIVRGVPVVSFTANQTSGHRPLNVAFTDTSTGNPTEWFWNFGDGTTSTDQNPVHTYSSAGNYSVRLNATNIFGTATHIKEEYIRVTEESFIDFIINENVFVYGNVLSFSGNTVTGPGATVVITGGLNTADLNRGASIAVSDIYIDGDANLDGGSAGLGSAIEPGNIYINGDLTLRSGSRDIHGDVYVAGNFFLKDARIHENVYVDGDLTLDWTPWLAEDARIYYTGAFTHPAYMDSGILSKCIYQATVPGFDMPDQEISPTKPADWYAARGYVSGGALTSDMMIYAPSYASTSWRPSATNIIVIAQTGDITITGMGDNGVTGVFFAPNGKVTFGGAFLEGVVIARDGFFVTSGGTTVTFKNIEEYISDPDDYPF